MSNRRRLQGRVTKGEELDNETANKIKAIEDNFKKSIEDERLRDEERAVLVVK